MVKQPEQLQQHVERLAAWLRHHVAFVASILVLIVVTLALVGVAAGAFTGNSATHTTPPSGQTAHGRSTLPSGVIASTLPANARVFAMPNGNAGLMMPAVDAQGSVWIGEMDLNRLARLDPQSGQVSEWAPPNGKYAIMQIVADGNGRIWFAEEAANYIGRFDPATQSFSTFPLPFFGSTRFGPQDLKFDSHGMLWFTGLESGRIGELNPITSQVQSWLVPGVPGKSSSPYCLALAPDGKVWYGQLGGAVGWLDPTTGATQVYPLADTTALVFSMTADSHGTIWFTELSDGKLGRIDPATAKVTELAVPPVLGNPQGLYQVIAKGTDIWFACSGANALVRYVPSHGTFTFYQIAQGDSVPYGLTTDSAGHIWFTADGAPNYIGEVAA
jgi:streptogramin lyase